MAMRLLTVVSRVPRFMKQVSLAAKKIVPFKARLSNAALNSKTIFGSRSLTLIGHRFYPIGYVAHRMHCSFGFQSPFDRPTLLGYYTGQDAFSRFRGVKPGVWSKLEEVSESIISRRLEQDVSELHANASSIQSCSQLIFGSVLDRKCEGVVSAAAINDLPSVSTNSNFPSEIEIEPDSYEKYPLACKMYWFRKPDFNSIHSEIPKHFCIVPVLSEFVDKIRQDIPGISLYHPTFDCIPETNYQIYERFQCNLAYFLESHNFNLDPKVASDILLQLFECDVHMKKHNIVHRDIKPDNILVNCDNQGNVRIALTDFSDAIRQLDLYYVLGCSRGGNAYLMAPEIKNAESGTHLDYRKSDLWAIGALAYDLFTGSNPFAKDLDSANYSLDELPELVNAPRYVSWIVRQILHPNPAQRQLNSVDCADILHTCRMFSTGVDKLSLTSLFTSLCNSSSVTIPEEFLIRIASDCLSKCHDAKLRLHYYARLSTLRLHQLVQILKFNNLIDMTECMPSLVCDSHRGDEAQTSCH